MPSMLALTGIAAAVTVASVLAAGVSSRFSPGDRARSYMLHLAGGILFAVVMVELWPEVEQEGATTAKFVGLAAGAGLMLGVNALTRRLEREQEDGRSPWGLVIAALIDGVVDGMLIGIAYAADSTTGLLLGVGLAIERVTMTMVVTTELREDGCTGGRLAWLVALTTLPLVPAAIAGYALFADAGSAPNAIVLAMAVAALIYMVVAEMLSRGLDARESMGTLGLFFLGFILLAAMETGMPA